jgi:hypothetical protein
VIRDDLLVLREDPLPDELTTAAVSVLMLAEAAALPVDAVAEDVLAPDVLDVQTRRQ